MRLDLLNDSEKAEVKELLDRAKGLGNDALSVLKKELAGADTLVGQLEKDLKGRFSTAGVSAKDDLAKDLATQQVPADDPKANNEKATDVPTKNGTEAAGAGASADNSKAAKPVAKDDADKK